MENSEVVVEVRNDGSGCWCAVCGCSFGMPDVQDGVPDEEDPEVLDFRGAYNAWVLSREQTQWLTDFRLVGCAADISSFSSERDIVNESDTPGLFISQPAKFGFSTYQGYPSIPNCAGEMEQMSIYETMANRKHDVMLFPIHQSCLDLINRICQLRQAQAQPGNFGKPSTLTAFCDALQKRRWENELEAYKYVNDSWGYCDGIEWPHNYYGARQFWDLEWESVVGWEFLCADPSASKIPKIAPYLMEELSKSPEAPITRAKSANGIDVANHLGWLFPEELSMLSDLDMDVIDIDQAVQGLARTVDETTQEMLDNYTFRCVIANEAVLINHSREKPSALPLGLKNRWRIWKILEQI